MTTSAKTDQTKRAPNSLAAPELLEEDGWLFRERPGNPVECVRRASEEMRGDPSPLYHPRHNYPST